MIPWRSDVWVVRPIGMDGTNHALTDGGLKVPPSVWRRGPVGAWFHLPDETPTHTHQGV